MNALRRGVLDADLVRDRAELFARAANDGTHPRLPDPIAEAGEASLESADDQLAHVLGLVLDGLLSALRE